MRLVLSVRRASIGLFYVDALEFFEADSLLVSSRITKVTHERFIWILHNEIDDESEAWEG